MEHKCEANRWQIKIKYYENPGLWIWGDISKVGANRINVCPYCGLKLEPPKPEFDFDKWHDELWHAYAIELSERTDRLFMGDDPEPSEKKDVRLAYLQGIEAAVCSPYGKIAFPYAAEKAIKTFERWASEIDSEQGNSHGGSHLTDWIRGIVKALEESEPPDVIEVSRAVLTDWEHRLGRAISDAAGHACLATAMGIHEVGREIRKVLKTNE